MIWKNTESGGFGRDSNRAHSRFKEEAFPLDTVLSKTACIFCMNIYDLFNDAVGEFMASNGTIIRK
jgi:hypothetical protein